MKTVKVTCAECGDDFDKSVSEYNRTVRLGKKHFCGLSCSRTNANHTMVRTPKSWAHLRPDNNRDAYTAFRYFLNSGHRSIKRHGCELTLEQLQAKWTAQRGVCPYTGLAMQLPDNVAGWKEPGPTSASLDRIDSSLGYTQDNIEFVCRFVNLGKSSFSRSVAQQFIAAIRSTK